jgi:hypothetical protein
MFVPCPNKTDCVDAPVGNLSAESVDLNCFKAITGSVNSDGGVIPPLQEVSEVLESCYSEVYESCESQADANDKATDAFVNCVGRLIQEVVDETLLPPDSFEIETISNTEVPMDYVITNNNTGLLEFWWFNTTIDGVDGMQLWVDKGDGYELMTTFANVLDEFYEFDAELNLYTEHAEDWTFKVRYTRAGTVGLFSSEAQLLPYMGIVIAKQSDWSNMTARFPVMQATEFEVIDITSGIETPITTLPYNTNGFLTFDANFINVEAIKIIAKNSIGGEIASRIGYIATYSGDAGGISGFTPTVDGGASWIQGAVATGIGAQIFSYKLLNGKKMWNKAYGSISSTGEPGSAGQHYRVAITWTADSTAAGYRLFRGYCSGGWNLNSVCESSTHYALDSALLALTDNDPALWSLVNGQPTIEP